MCYVPVTHQVSTYLNRKQIESLQVRGNFPANPATFTAKAGEPQYRQTEGRQSPDIIFSMSTLDEHTVDFLSRSAEQTRRVGTHLGRDLQAGDVICLQGDLGAGKTTLVQGIAQGWGSLDAVSSPTFIIVNVYRDADSRQLFHLDAYRLESTLEADELDLNTMLAQGPLIIEWPERMEKLIPRERLWVRLEHVDQAERKMNFESHGKRYDLLLDVIRSAIHGAD